MHQQQPADPRDGHHPGLELEDDPAFQRHLWAVERAGWAGICLLLLAALLGLFGAAGPLADATAASADGGLRLRYARFARHSAATALEVELGPTVTTGEHVRVAIDRAFLDGVEVRDVLPEPEAVELGDEELVYVFSVADPGRALVVTFALEPRRYGPQRGWVALPGGERLAFAQFVYP